MAEVPEIEAKWRMEEIKNKRIDAIIKLINKAEKIKTGKYKEIVLEVLQSRLSSLGASYSLANIANRQSRSTDVM